VGSVCPRDCRFLLDRAPPIFLYQVLILAVASMSVLGSCALSDCLVVDYSSAAKVPSARAGVRASIGRAKRGALAVLFECSASCRCSTSPFSSAQLGACGVDIRAGCGIAEAGPSVGLGRDAYAAEALGRPEPTCYPRRTFENFRVHRPAELRRLGRVEVP
jgi:hypothetical protein